MSDLYLYHVTYYRHLPAIEEEGLVAAASAGIGGAGYDKSQGVFLTESEGVPFWYMRAEDWARHRSDDLLEDELAPVVLRVSDGGVLHQDIPGTRDAGASAWVSEEIPPEDIEVWDGEEWVALEDFDTPVDEAFETDEYEEDSWSVLLDGFENPFYPPDEAYE